MKKYQISKSRYEFRRDSKDWTNDDIKQKIMSWDEDTDLEVIKECSYYEEAKEFFEKEKQNLPFSDYFEGNVFTYVEAYMLELDEVTVDEDGEPFDWYSKDFYISPIQEPIQQELCVTYNENEVFFADSFNAANNPDIISPDYDDIEEDTTEGYIKAIAKSHPQYREFIETHIDELCREYEEAQQMASRGADMYAGDVYGKSEANMRAASEIPGLRNVLNLNNEGENTMDFKIETNYAAQVFFETSVAVNGQSYLVIYGEHINGNFCCVPAYGWGCEMAEPSDVFYNSRNLENCGAPKEIAQALAEAISERSKETDLSQKNLTTSFIDRALAEQLKTDAVKREEANQNRLSVLYIEPNKPPRTVKIDNSLEAMQALVGGNIEVVHPFSDNAALVCNEEGIIMHLPLNRAICNEYYNGIINGSFFICYTPPESEEFLSLPSDLEKKYSEMFKYPERFINTANGIKVEKTKPARTAPKLF